MPGSTGARRPTGASRRRTPRRSCSCRDGPARPDLGAPFACLMAMRLSHTTTQFPSNVLRIATYNTHKGGRGGGPRKRLEIHNLVLGIEALDADFVFLQEVRRMNRAE